MFCVPTQLAGAVRTSGYGHVVEAGTVAGDKGDAGGQVGDIVHRLLD